MYPRIIYLNAAKNFRAAWTCANLLARYMPNFSGLDAANFGLELVEVNFVCGCGVEVAPITRAIKRAAEIAACTENDVIAALAATPRVIPHRVADYLETLANRGVLEVCPSADMLSGLYGRNKYILQCLIMALLNI